MVFNAYLIFNSINLIKEGSHLKYDRNNLTGAIFKDARQNILGISQTLVTQHTGISAKDISLFENGRSLLPDIKREKLSEFLELKLNYQEAVIDVETEAGSDDEVIEVDDDLSSVSSPEMAGDDCELSLTHDLQMKGFSHVDGVIIPPSLSFDDAEKSMKNYHENMEKIHEYLEMVAPRSFGGDINLDAVLNDVLLPSIRALSSLYSLTQGEEIFPNMRPNNNKIDKDNGVVTYRDVIGHLLSTPLNRGIF